MPKIPADVIAAARASQAKWKVPASISIAQWAVESNWGKSLSGKNNPFGIKALPGLTSTPRWTWEHINGQNIRMVQNFADFKSLTDAFDQHGKLLGTSRYYTKARATKTADAFANALTGIYATAPNYGATLISIMKANNLYQYDKAA